MCFILKNVSFLGKIYNEEWRLVIWRNALGNFDLCSRTTLRVTERRTSHRESVEAVRNKRSTRKRGRPTHPVPMSSRSARPDERVLATRRKRATFLQRNSPFPSEEEPWIRPQLWSGKCWRHAQGLLRRSDERDGRWRLRRYRRRCWRRFTMKLSLFGIYHTFIKAEKVLTGLQTSFLKSRKQARLP